MKKRLFILFTVLSLSITGQSQKYKKITIDYNKYYVCPEYKSVNYQSFICTNNNKKCKLPNGKWIILYKEDTTKIYLKFELYNCQKINKAIQYYFNGNIEKEQIYEDNEVVYFKTYYENGQIKSEGQSDFIILKRKRRYWFRTKAKMLYPIGIWKEWYKNGELKVLKEHNNNIMINPIIKNPFEEIYFRNLNGKIVYYYENGNKKKEMFFKNDKIDSLYSVWYENGQIKEQLLFDNGTYVDTNKTTIIYYPDGSIKEKGKRKMALKSGKWVGYYPNGTLRYEGCYEIISYYIGDWHIPNFTNIKTGEWIYYYPNGQIMAKGYYVKDINENANFKRKEGWLFWNKKGDKTLPFNIEDEYIIDN